MKGEDLFIALGKIDDKFIESAAPKKTVFYKKSGLKWAVAIAACLCLILLVFPFVSNTGEKPLKKIENYSVNFGAMGYEGTDELSLKNSNDINPWNEKVKIESLPVYKNLCYNSGKLSQGYYSLSQLKKQTLEVAKKLNLSLSPEQMNETESEEIYSYALQTSAGTVVSSGKGINLIITNGDSSLINKHMELTFGGKSSDKIVLGDYSTYSVDGELVDKETRSYLKGKNIVEDILNFNFNSHYLIRNDSEVTSLGDCLLNASEKLGEYPIKSLDKAKENLLSGEYVTSADEKSVQGGKLREEVIAKTDLIYYTAGNQELYLPYYRFYVNYYSGGDIQQYAYFYVCAVADEYLGSYTTFEGSYQ